MLFGHIFSWIWLAKKELRRTPQYLLEISSSKVCRLPIEEVNSASPPPPPLPHRALELGDEGQLLFWHFPSFLWTEIASAIPEWSIKSLLRGVKWHCLPKTAQFDQKRTNFFGMGWVSQMSIRFGHRSLASVKTHGSNSVQNGLYSLLCWHN